MSFLKRTVFSVAEYLTPVLTTSQFYKSGQLTPEEFVLSGDQLVSKCPSWHWGTGAESTIKDYLPKDKQYLYTKGVVCVQRATAIGNALAEEEEEGGDDWIVTTNNNINTSDKPSVTTPETTTSSTVAVEDDDEPYDLDDMDYGDLGEEEEQASASIETPAVTAVSTTPASMDKKDPALNIRTYDISIVYDKLYRCPRVYLQGYNHAGKPLTEQEVQEDISADHMNKTVTWEIFPYSNYPCMSIHPCQHAHTMKRMLEIMVSEEYELIQSEQKRHNEKESDASDQKNVLSALGGKDDKKDVQKDDIPQYDEAGATQEAWKRVQERMSVDKALFLFLKFVATVVPTIDYDNTITIDIF